MNDRDLEPMAPHLHALLKSEQELLAPPAGEKEVVLAAIEAAITTGVVSAAAASANSAAGATATGLQTVGVLKALFVSRVSLGLAMFALGGAAGATLAAAALHVWPPQAPSTRIAPSAPSVPVAAQTLGEPAVPTPPAPPVQTEPAEPAAAMTPTATAPKAPAPAPRTQAGKRPDPNRGLAEEAGLLQAARVALAPDPGGALSLIDQHAERFPGGQLVQEREALRVQALVSAGRFDEARAAGARLEQRFPESLSLPSVRKALASIPDRASPKE